MNPLRIYLDTSIFGGLWDKEFREPTLILFEQIKTGKFDLVTSEVVQAEIELAPSRVQQSFKEFLPLAELVVVRQEAINLQQAYLRANIVSVSHTTDALHVALATVSDCSSIVSWNFRHIVHFQKVPLYNAVNLTQGYSQIAINSPQEVIIYD